MRGPKMSRAVVPTPVRVKARAQTPAEAQAVYDLVTARDKTCRAPIIEATYCGKHRLTPCSGRDEREHVRYAAAMGGRRITIPEGVLLLCHQHHQGGWASAHKPMERAYLAGLYPKEKE
jgi:hypothetical protein